MFFYHRFVNIIFRPGQEPVVVILVLAAATSPKTATCSHKQTIAYSRTSIARATSQTVCHRHRTRHTTYPRNASQNLRPVARAIIYSLCDVVYSLLRPA